MSSSPEDDHKEAAQTLDDDSEGVGDSALKGPFNVTLGLRLEAKDYNGLWYPAKVMDIDDEKQLAHVHFEGWSSRFDEWISLSSTGSRLRPLLRQSQRRDSEKSKRSQSDPRTDFYVGEIVLARWTDCRMYPAKILVANHSSFDMVFYDGFRKTVQHSNVKPMTNEMRREFHLPDDGTAGTTCLFGEKKKSGKQVKEALASGNGGKTDSKLKGAEAQEEDRKGKKRKRTVTAESVGGGDESETAVSASNSVTSASSSSSSSSSSSTSVEDRTATKKGRGRPPILDKESAVGSAKKLKRDPEEPIASLKEEWKCNVKECAKTFRKESLLVYHLKYYHLDEQTVAPPPPPLPLHASTKSVSTPSKSFVKSGICKSATPPSSAKESGLKVEKHPELDLEESNFPDADLLHPEPIKEEPTPVSPVISSPLTERSKESKSKTSGDPTSTAPSATSTPSTPAAPPNRKRKRHVSSTTFEESLATNASIQRTPNCSVNADDDTTLEFVAPTSSSRLSFSSNTSSTIEEGGIGDEERIRCVCQIYEVTPESGKMLRCKRCKSWQHSSCFILPEDEDEESYLCYICSHPPGIRDSKRRLEEMEEYLSSGELTRFPVPNIKKTSTGVASIPSHQPEVKQPMTYGKSDSSKSNSLDTLAAVNLRGYDTQAGFFKAVGKVVNNVCAGVHRVNDCLHGTGLRMHRLKQTRESGEGGSRAGLKETKNAQVSLATTTTTTTASTSENTANETLKTEPITDSSKTTPSRSSFDRLLAGESALIDADHDALEAQLAAMEAEMDEVERLWDASDEFVSLPPGKKAANDDASSSSSNPSPALPQKIPTANGELENKFRIKRALRGLIEDLNQVQQIAFLQTVKQ